LFGVDESLDYLKEIMPGNKALGLLAQLDFENWVMSQGVNVQNKYMQGCWLVASRSDDFYALRTCFFVWPEVVKAGALPSLIQGLERSRQFHGMCSSLNNSSLDVIHCFATFSGSQPTLTDVSWNIFRYRNERLAEQSPDRYFAGWKGRGRRSLGKPWKDETTHKFNQLNGASLTRIVLPQLFYNGFFKGVYSAGTMDPYDTDGFVVSYDGRVFPVELKEKFPFEHQSIGKTFGVDAGRILMLLRICLPTNSNAFYIVREVDESSHRGFVNWKFIRLDEVLMKCSWQLQAGGPGMASSATSAGSQTSTVLIPYRCFSTLTPEVLSDGYLGEISSLSENARDVAKEFLKKMRALDT
jgi:hypothetical protein